MRDLIITAAAGGGILLMLIASQAIAAWLGTMPWTAPVLLLGLFIGTAKLLLAIMRAADKNK
jgi:hypothetical protein